MFLFFLGVFVGCCWFLVGSVGLLLFGLLLCFIVGVFRWFTCLSERVRDVHLLAADLCVSFEGFGTVRLATEGNESEPKSREKRACGGETSRARRTESFSGWDRLCVFAF